MSDIQDVSNRVTAGKRLTIPRTASVIVVVVAVAIALIFLVPRITGSFVAANNVTGDGAGDAVRRLPVLVEPIIVVDRYEQKRSYTGLVRSKQKADLGFELMGRVEHVLVDEGEIVKAGQLLAKLDTESLKARKKALTASLRQAEALLTELKRGPRQQTKDSMKAQLDEARSNLALAKTNLTRREQLRGRGVSQEEYDQAKFSVQAASERVRSLEEQLAELIAGTRQEKIDAQEAARDQLNASIEEIDIQIGKGNLLAPFGGKIVERLIDPGSIINSSTPILKIVDFQNLEAVIGLPVAAAQSLHEGQDYNIQVGQELFTAQLIAKIQELEMATRTQNLIFEIEDYANQKIIPGQLCQLEVATEVEMDEETFSIPASSLTNGIRGLWSVFIVDHESSRIRKADVQIVYTDGHRSLVKGSIEGGQNVIVDGTHRVVDGQYVEPVSERQAAAR